jgi:hypothetical protein
LTAGFVMASKELDVPAIVTPAAAEHCKNRRRVQRSSENETDPRALRLFRGNRDRAIASSFFTAA